MFELFMHVYSCNALSAWGQIYKISYDKLRIKCDLGKS